MIDFSPVRGLAAALLVAPIVWYAMGDEDSRWWWLTVPVVGAVCSIFKEEED